MKRHRWTVLALLLGLFVAAGAAACGGDDEESENATTGNAAENVSGSVVLLADWTGPEGESFKAVIEGFKKAYPNVNARYRPSTNLGQDLSTAVEGGNPPDLAAIPSPGIMADYQKRGVLKPLTFAKSDIEQNYSTDWQDLGKINGTYYGVFFKGANKSTVWYSKKALSDAGVEPPTSFDDLITAMGTIKASGLPPMAIGGSEGWTLTDLFENIYARSAGPDMYRKLAAHEIKWTDPSVTKALTEMGKILDGKNLLGGTAATLQLSFDESCAKVLNVPAQAALNFEGDFVPGVVAGKTNAKAGTDYDFFEFPKVGSSEDLVVSGGNVVIMFKDTPASQALVKYLASPEAGEIWAKRGGFTSPNKNVSADTYASEIDKRAREPVASGGTVVFDLSDQAPGAFGSGDEFTIMQGFLKNPSDVQGTAKKLEDAAAKAYKTA